MSSIHKYGDVLKQGSRLSRDGGMRVMFVRFAVGREVTGKGGQWFYGLVVAEDNSGNKNLRTIQMFPLRGWVRAE